MPDAPGARSRNPAAAKTTPAKTTPAKRVPAKAATTKTAPVKAASASPPKANRGRRIALISGGAVVALLGVVAALFFVPSRGPGPEFVTREGDHLMLNGQQFTYASTNTYELMFGQPVTIDAYFQRMVDEGFTVLRTWAFYDVATEDGTGGVEIANKGTWFQYFDPETGAPAYNDGPTGLEHLDEVIASAGEHGIKLILPLVNNWTSFGGIDQYVQWAGGLWHDDFMTNETIKGWYKAWVDHLLNRVNTITGVVYKDDPTIMAWELANEMRCSESGPYLSSAACNPSTILAWVDEMSTYVKSIDHNHLVSFGSEGFLCTNYGKSDTLTNCTESADPVAVTALPNIDMHGIHLYPDHWNPTEPTDDWAAWGVWWIDQQAAIAEDAGKPFYIGEYGWRGKSTRLPVFNQWLTAAYADGADGTNFWMMQPTNPGFTPPDNDGFVVYCPSAVCTLVSNWNKVVSGQADWSEFGPIGDGEFVTTDTGTPITFSLIANDLAFGDATLDLNTVDLDPTTSGVQTTLTLERGTYVVENGVVTFTPLPGVEGSARMRYTIADSEGRVSDPISVSVVMVTP